MAKYNSIPIFKAEQQANLGEVLASYNSVAYISPLKTTPGSLSVDVVSAEARKHIENTFGSVTFDLHPVYTILVSTGWNKNDDVFTKHETWGARNTPEDKPFNIEHTPRQIIGHITNNTVVDKELLVIADDTPLDEVPNLFHILTSAVVYKHISSRDEELEAEAAELIEGIQGGEWFVSMECLFSNFDYGLVYNNDEHQIIARNETTAFLTQHLRVYGGEGEYNGGKLGRVLKNITFSGKGLVKNPANPESVIFNNDTENFVGVFSSQSFIDNDNNKKGEIDMSDKYISQLETQTQELQAKLADATKRIEELGEAHVNATLAEKDGEIEKLKGELTKAQTEMNGVSEQLSEVLKEKETAEGAKSELQKELDAANEKIAESEKRVRMSGRVAMLVDTGVDKPEAEQIVADFDGLDDDKFTKIVEMAKKKKKDEDDEEDDEDDKKEAKGGVDDNADPDGETSADTTDLDDSEPENDVTLGSGDGENEQAELMKALSSYFDTAMHGEDSK